MKMNEMEMYSKLTTFRCFNSITVIALHELKANAFNTGKRKSDL